MVKLLDLVEAAGVTTLREALVARELERYKMNIAAFSETHLADEGQLTEAGSEDCQYPDSSPTGSSSDLSLQQITAPVTSTQTLAITQHSTSRGPCPLRDGLLAETFSKPVLFSSPCVSPHRRHWGQPLSLNQSGECEPRGLRLRRGPPGRESRQMAFAMSAQRLLQQRLRQLERSTRGLKQELKSLQSLAKDFEKFQEKYKTALKEFLAVTEKQHVNNLDVNQLQERVFQLEKSLQEVNGRYNAEKQKRKMLHNALTELRGNIRVHCRVRPPMSFNSVEGDASMLERSVAGSEQVIHLINDETIQVKCSRSGLTAVTRCLNLNVKLKSNLSSNNNGALYWVYGRDDSQESIFEEVRPLLTSLLDGYNVCIMAYGQSGSGKTYTMLGPHSEENFTFSTEPKVDEGIIPKAARELYSLMSERPSETYSVEVSVVEVYNNDIIDLLGKRSGGNLRVKREAVATLAASNEIPLLASTLVKNLLQQGAERLLTITYCRMLSPESGYPLKHPPGEKHVENPTSILNVISHGLQHRAKHPTLIHAHSSRSHLVITIAITTKAIADNRADHSSELSFQSIAAKQSNTEASVFSKHLKSKLQLVDLAGSECIGMSGVTGSALRETSFINRSLSALADVFGALAEQRSHIPYRNSKLTHLLQDSLGGDAKLLVMVCVSPGQKYITESLQSLGFGYRARQVQKGHARKIPARQVGGNKYFDLQTM
ncbi:kinesin-like protein KIF25 [Hemitrygon akajei]|uniref:kinesin-like protein KIF25 n=1 Tax=Hemitrygon akajei TaxID=2704970 RepID=UPI003BF9780E